MPVAASTLKRSRYTGGRQGCCGTLQADMILDRGVEHVAAERDLADHQRDHAGA
ncbi:MAG: hypothetical protein U0Z44_07380 [Kouleothrix sp.]